MDWLSDASGGGDISGAIDAITAGGIVALCLMPTFTILFIIVLIVKIVKWRKVKKSKRNKHNKPNKPNKHKETVNSDTNKIQDVQLGKDTKRRAKKRISLGLTSEQLHAELNYDTVDVSVLDNIKEPEHSMDLNMTFDSNGKVRKTRKNSHKQRRV